MRQSGRIREVVTYDHDSGEWRAMLVVDGRPQGEAYATHKGGAYKAIGAMRREATRQLLEGAK